MCAKGLPELRGNGNPEKLFIMGIMVFEGPVMLIFLALISSGLSAGDGFSVSTILLQLGSFITVAFDHQVRRDIRVMRS